MSQQELDALLSSAEQIAVIGSPSSTAQLAIDVLAPAAVRKLVGELAVFGYTQDGYPHYALGQITSVTLRNVWHEDPTMRSLIRQRGQVDPVSGRQDTHLGEMSVSAVFMRDRTGYRPSFLGTVPPTGTRVFLARDDQLSTVLAHYRDQLFYLGTVFGSTPRLPMWFKHFDQGPHGAGEAYHLGIFGKTGSGKSVLAKMILLAYARHRDMALLVIDPQGEFAKDARGSPGGGFPLRLDLVLRRLEREPVVVGVRQLVLDRWDLFEEILYESDFFEQLTIPRGENRRLACGTLRDRLDRSGVKLADLHGRRSFEQAWALLGDERIQRVFYRSEGSRERFRAAYEEADPNEFYGLRWLPLARLFQWEPGKQRVEALLQDMFTRSPRPLVVVDLSAQQQGDLLWNDTIQALVIKRLLEGIRFASERAYQGNRSLNTLVVIDEAHRLAPRERLEDEHRQRIRDTLVDAVRTTRKYGLGWMFISQTLASLHMEIIQQLRIMCFGFGLGLGSEFAALRELVGGDTTALDLYRLFRDPHSAFDPAGRQYSFMTVGPVSPLSFAGTPLFFNAFTTPEEFLRANRLTG